MATNHGYTNMRDATASHDTYASRPLWQTLTRRGRRTHGLRPRVTNGETSPQEHSEDLYE